MARPKVVDYLCSIGEVRRRCRVMPLLLLALAIAALVLPEVLGFAIGSRDYAYRLASKAVIMGLFGLGLNVVYGYAGMVSFGHSALFGGGSYVAAALVTRAGVDNMVLTLVVATLAGGALGAAMGVLIARTHGVAIVLVTFALAQILWLLSYLDPLGMTGGEGGITGVRAKAAEAMSVALHIDEPVGFYLLAVVITLASGLVLKATLDGPFGLILKAVRDDAQRTVTLGYHVGAMKALAFVLSGLICGLAGGLWAYLNGIVSPEDLHWGLSGDALLFAVLGGQSIFLGPVVGAALVVLLQAVLSDMLVSWPFILGLIYILIVIFMKDGVLLALRDGIGRLRG